ncbi:phage major capsid protein [Clostridium sp. J1101437_171009_A5]|uniref:phage major capsid protein n=1 Tax=Clostridium sp. J1101437_171009_A5 TaxID=2787098 RepID=UPI00189A5890|nr:phage major capsid protein [Clostridium sp. J1101437_171009_A5]
MDFMEKIADLRAQKSQLLAKAQTAADEGNYDEVDQITNQMEGINNQISSLEKLARQSQENADPVYDGILHDKNKTPKEGRGGEEKPFASIGEQLAAIYNFRKNHIEDKRLQQVNNAVLGTNEGIGADGGFAIQTDFAGAILESAVQMSPLLNRLDRYTCSSAANSMRWISADETDVSQSVFGGVQMYWAAEGAAVAASKPQFREIKMDLEKMMGFLYCTDEMLQDAAFMSGFASTGFALAGDRLLTDAVIAGNGSGKPLGFINSKALITVDKEPSQTAGTFVGNNAVKMQARSMPRGRERLVWLMHPDAEEQLPLLVIKGGDESKFLWTPEGGLGNFDTQRVLHKPVLFEDSCSALGTKGDIMLVDPFQYILLTKGAVKQDWSIHVEFLTDQNCFRVVFRCNGAPKVNSPLKIKNSTKLRSPFVALADRK